MTLGSQCKPDFIDDWRVYVTAMTFGALSARTKTPLVGTKRLLDFILTMMVLLFCWPILFGVSVAIAMTSPAPVFQGNHALRGEHLC